MKWLIAFQDLGKNLLGGLNQSLGPARLLGLECGHFDRKLGGAFDVLQVNKLPPLQLGTIREIGVFRQRVVLPATRLINCRTAPHASGAVEVEKYVTAGSP